MPETTNPGRVNPVTVANAAENQRLATITGAPVSPTGTPVLPPHVALWAAVAVALATAIQFIPGVPPVVLAIAGVVISLGTILGIASPGIRK